MGLALPYYYEVNDWQSNLGDDISTENQGDTITAGGTANTKGTYVTLISSTDYDVYGFYLLIQEAWTNGAQVNMLLDIRIGGASGKVILPDWQIGARHRGREGSWSNYFPLFIPRGMAVDARIQANTASDTAQVVIFLCKGTSGVPDNIYDGCDAYGANTSDSGGVAHTAGNTVFSTAANVGSTLSNNYKAAMLSLATGAATLGERRYLWRLLVGSVVKATWLHHSASDETILTCQPSTAKPMDLPSGSQLQVQGKCNAAAHVHDIAFHCFY